VVDWGWLDEQEVISETEFLRHIRFSDPLRVRVDGRTGRGIVQAPSASMESPFNQNGAVKS